MMMQPRVYDEQFLFAAVVILSMALIFYSVGVWSERIQGRLKGWHVVALGLGVVCNFAGTTFMGSWHVCSDMQIVCIPYCVVFLFFDDPTCCLGFLDFPERSSQSKIFFQSFWYCCLEYVADSLYCGNLHGNWVRSLNKAGFRRKRSGINWQCTNEFPIHNQMLVPLVHCIRFYFYFAATTSISTNAPRVGL